VLCSYARLVTFPQHQSPALEAPALPLPGLRFCATLTLSYSRVGCRAVARCLRGYPGREAGAQDKYRMMTGTRTGLVSATRQLRRMAFTRGEAALTINFRCSSSGR
jgi:hypothetical protein